MIKLDILINIKSNFIILFIVKQIQLKYLVLLSCVQISQSPFVHSFISYFYSYVPCTTN